MKTAKPENIKWHLNVKRPNYLLDLSLVSAGDLEELGKLTGISYSQVFAVMENGQAEWYAPQDEVFQQVKKLIKDLKRVEKIISLLPEHKARVVKEIKNNKYSVASFNKLFKVYRLFSSFRVVTRVVGYQSGLDRGFIDKVAKARLEFKNGWIDIRNSLDQIWSLIARKYKIPKEAVKSLTYQEFLGYLQKKNFSGAVKKAKERQTRFVFYKTKKSEKILIGEKAEKFIKNVLGEKKSEKIKIVKGQVACPGKAKGKVKVVLDPDKIKISKKIILVTSMTTPQFVPLLKNVKAIITDEGGLTCHAAIISRELGIPCIIGTKIATQVFKDGDLVEVDADKGIVRKLNK